MLMTVLGKDLSASYGELAGVRVLITGLSPSCGVDVARAFAEHRGRLLVHTGSLSQEIDVVGTLLAQTAAEVQLFNGAYSDAKSATRFAQSVAQAFGGLDVVINLVPLSAEDLSDKSSYEEIEDLLAQKLELPLTISRVAANRMKLLLTEGLLLNVVTAPVPRTSAQAAMCGIVRTALADLTRGEAGRISGNGIRVNAIGPRTDVPETGATIAAEPDIAALALYLASKHGRTLTGHIFDAAGVASKRC
jgi:3-oxoacyl-[acyl-carrier protein] reductase